MYLLILCIDFCYLSTLLLLVTLSEALSFWLYLCFQPFFINISLGNNLEVGAVLLCFSV